MHENMIGKHLVEIVYKGSVQRMMNENKIQSMGLMDVRWI